MRLTNRIFPTTSLTNWKVSIQGICSPSQEESWKPFRRADEESGGGGGGGAPEPGLSGGGGGTAPPLGFSNPPLEGSWGVAGSALEVLPFLVSGGGGGGRDPENNENKL